MPTTDLYDCVQHFLQYAATYPNAILQFSASDMRYIISSDASYLSETRARSRSAGDHYLSSNGDPLKAPINGPVEAISTIIQPVVSAAYEAEIGGVFINAEAGEANRRTLSDLGYPQDATPIITDNTTAQGFAHKTIRLKRSKAMDMRWYWVQDRIANGDYVVTWGPGADNAADYLTKVHPAKHYRALRHHYVQDPIPKRTP